MRSSFSARFGRAATVVAIAVFTAALTAPGQAAGAEPSVTISGTVTDGTGPAVGTTALAGVRVGFRESDGTVDGEVRTDTAGRFALTVPAAATGVVYAGARPTAAHALFSVGTHRFVRGLIGGARPTGAPGALTAAAAPASTIAGAGALAFRLQRPGRIAGTDPLLAGQRSAAEVDRLDGSRVLAAAADATGAFHTAQLVPGTYAVVLRPRSPYLAASVARVRVVAGTTTTVAAPAFVRGAGLAGRITSGGSPAAVPLTVFGSDGLIAARSASDASGAYAVGRLAPGVYSVVFGASYAAADAVPTTTAAALPARRRVVVDASRSDVALDVDLPRAAQLSGVATGLRGGSVAVVAERADGTVVAGTIAGASGAYTLGGLTPGLPLRIVALTGGGTDQRYGTLAVTPVAGPQTVAVVDASATTPILLSGSAHGVGAVQVRASAQVLGAAEVSGGRYRIAVVPGRYTLTASAPGRIDRVVTVRVVGETTKALAVGPKAAHAIATVRAPGTTQSRVTVTAATGGVGVLVPAPHGRLALRGKVAGGSYRFTATSFAAPAADGPWWFTVPTAAVVLTAGTTVDLGVLRLQVGKG